MDTVEQLVMLLGLLFAIIIIGIILNFIGAKKPYKKIVLKQSINFYSVLIRFGIFKFLLIAVTIGGFLLIEQLKPNSDYIAATCASFIGYFFISLAVEIVILLYSLAILYCFKKTRLFVNKVIDYIFDNVFLVPVFKLTNNEREIERQRYIESRAKFYDKHTKFINSNIGRVIFGKKEKERSDKYLDFLSLY